MPRVAPPGSGRSTASMLTANPASRVLLSHFSVACRDEIVGNMYTNDPRNKDGLAISYSFDPESVFKSPDGKVGGRYPRGGSLPALCHAVYYSSTCSFLAGTGTKNCENVPVLGLYNTGWTPKYRHIPAIPGSSTSQEGASEEHQSINTQVHPCMCREPSC